MRDKPQILNSQTVAKTRLFHVEQLDLKFSNGIQVQFERLRSSSAGAVLVVPMQDNDTVLLINEYAAGVHRYELALPKGRIEQGEDMLVAANRELKEEIGFGAKQLRHLKTVTLAPGYFGHETHIILAEDLYPEKLTGDEPEEIEVIPWPINNIDELLSRQDCSEARSITALYLVRDLLANKRNK